MGCYFVGIVLRFFHWRRGIHGLAVQQGGRASMANTVCAA
eukprot:COSAG02_NODE_595_length_19813_cov_12.215380_5_plen_40_part_00